VSAVGRLAPAAILTDEAAGALTFAIESKFVKQIPELFRWIEANTAAKGSKGATQSEGVQLTDWSISHTTLEDVFIRLTRIHDDKSDKPPACKAAAVPVSMDKLDEGAAESPYAVSLSVDGQIPKSADDPEHAADPDEPEASDHRFNQLELF